MYIDDETRLHHILDAAREALSFVAGRQPAELDSDRMLYRAIVSCLAEIGEAASRLTPEARTTLPRLPWPQIVGMRDRLVHGYFQINTSIVWDTVVNSLPPLVAGLEEWFAREADETN
jgi:uncharacterized protein with HEPN domain